jgi:hypothetical protein
VPVFLLYRPSKLALSEVARIVPLLFCARVCRVVLQRVLSQTGNANGLAVAVAMGPCGAILGLSWLGGHAEAAFLNVRTEGDANQKAVRPPPPLPSQRPEFMSR